MPRSGSTLLCNILAQNPQFHSTPTSGLSELVRSINGFWKNNAAIKASDTPKKQLTIIRDLFYSYHSDTNRPIIFNKSRGWASLIELIENAFQKEVKIISTIRNVNCILSSLEKLYRKELKLIDSPMVANTETSTLEGRLGGWTSPEGLVGFSFNTIRDAIMRGHKKKFCFVDFDELTVTPDIKLKQIYDFLNEPYFKHDFDNVLQYTNENDTEHGFTSLHTIRPVIKPVFDDSKIILGDAWKLYCDFHYNF